MAALTVLGIFVYAIRSEADLEPVIPVCEQAIEYNIAAKGSPLENSSGRCYTEDEVITPMQQTITRYYTTKGCEKERDKQIQALAGVMLQHMKIVCLPYRKDGDYSMFTSKLIDKRLQRSQILQQELFHSDLSN